MSTETFSRPTPFGCTHTGPNASALRTPSHGATGCGAFQRSGPTGGAPNGMPRNTRTPSGEFAAGAIKPASVRTGSVRCRRQNHDRGKREGDANEGERFPQAPSP